MKKEFIINILGLMVFLGIVISCQSDQGEIGENRSPTSTPTMFLPEGGTATRENITVMATSVVEPTPTSTARATPTSVLTATPMTTGQVHIISEPSDVSASVINTDVNAQTPVIWTLLPGTYTVTLSMPGYEDWMTPITVTAGSQMTITAILRQRYTIIPVQDGIRAASSVQWSEDGQSLTYALANNEWPDHVQFLPVYQNWWRYDMVSGATQELPPPQTRVTDAVRESLGVCRFDEPESLPYPCLTTLQESPTSNRIAFSAGVNVSAEANTWLANIDGSEVVYLDTILGSPEEVMWSNDGKWLLIGRWAGIDNSHLYYLVSTDGSFVESLEDVTSISHWVVQGAKPQFSPDGQKLAFVGIETEGKQLTGDLLNQEEVYNLYVLDLTTMETQLVSPRFGLLQWAHDRNGLYVLDGSANTAGHQVDYVLSGVHYADLYYVDLTQETYPEQKLAGDIPLQLPYWGSWAYSPEARAMAGTFIINGPVFGILLLD